MRLAQVRGWPWRMDTLWLPLTAKGQGQRQALLCSLTRLAGTQGCICDETVKALGRARADLARSWQGRQGHAPPASSGRFALDLSTRSIFIQRPQSGRCLSNRSQIRVVLLRTMAQLISSPSPVRQMAVIRL
ncbi:hypothetical protein D3C87_1683730 [compost metagenome]